MLSSVDLQALNGTLKMKTGRREFRDRVDAEQNRVRNGRCQMCKPGASTLAIRYQHADTAYLAAK